jgi:erythromycin esterase
VKASRRRIRALVLLAALYGCRLGGGQAATSSEPPPSPGGDEASAPTLEASSESLGSHMITISGLVVDEAGAPLGGALAAAIERTSFRGVAFARTTAAGSFELRVAPGHYTVSATTLEGATGFAPSISVDGELAEEVTVEVKPPSATLTGTLTENHRGIAGARVRVALADGPRGATFYTESASDGSYSIGLTAKGAYAVWVEDARYVSVPERVSIAGDTALDIPVISAQRIDAPAPDSVIQWFRENAIALQSVEPGAPLDDLRALGSRIGSARVVAMGEATHGTREFFQLKHRVFEYLVAEHGFTVFAIEANWSEALAVNDYVLHGEGDPAAALAGLHFWTWDTEEVAALIEWMRQYNASNGPRLKFYGVDMQYTEAAAAALGSYLGTVDEKLAGELEKTLEDLGTLAWYRLPGERQEQIGQDLERAALRMRANKRRYVRRAGDGRWKLARQHLQVLIQAVSTVVRSPQTTSWDAREAAMADNLAWILEHEGEGARVFLWAHNGHVTRGPSRRGPAMGGYLADQLGSDYIAIGLAFGGGSFQAYDASSPDHTAGVIEHTVGLPQPRFLEASLMRIGHPLFAIDLRAARGVEPIAAWLDLPRPLREYGAIHQRDDYVWAPVRVADHFDILLFVERTTRARPTPSGYRGPRSFKRD